MTRVTVGVGLLADQPPEGFTRAVDAAESLGYDTIWIPDERFFRDVFVALALAASRTKRVRLGPCVTDAFIRHPAVTAMQMATLQAISGGRAVLGIGAGLSGFAALGIKPQNTVGRMREAIRVIRALLAGQEAVADKAGVRFRGKLDIPAVPPVPVYVAGRGPKILELAGEVGDAVMFGAMASAGAIAYGNARVEAGARRIGRDPTAIERALWIHTFLSKDGEKARRNARRIIVGIILSSKDILPSLGVTVPLELEKALEPVVYGYHWDIDAKILELIPEHLVDAFTLAGAPEEVAAKARRLVAAGYSHLALRLWTPKEESVIEPMTLFAEQVRPALA
ncbi:MAG: LLM class flavin-dependent oxidoreductase [Armatimonadetes bacterium]|nr:LLM class flavin-dependent oxidoreductase [Armatimonadota bacterium]